MSVFQPPVPKWLADLSDTDVHAHVNRLREKLRRDVVILGHHYQRDEVICHADYVGDSLRLARLGAECSDRRYIIFCGVHFMAETAVILSTSGQQVSLPDLNAGCDMADMAETRDVKEAWADAEAAGCRNIIPVTYVNSKASLKAFVGDHGGAACTSSNARKVVTWALERGEHLFFFPDQHLGRNICKNLGLDPERDMLLWDPKQPRGGHTQEMLKSRKIWLWQGHCPVHALFTVQQIHKLRAESPATKIIVHPECSMEIVDLADDFGSTEQIINKISASAPGTRWAVGTEKHLVERLAAEHSDKVITSLNPYTCLCATMNRISLRSLAWVLDDLDKGLPLRNSIEVPSAVVKSSRLALDRMMALS